VVTLVAGRYFRRVLGGITATAWARPIRPSSWGVYLALAWDGQGWDALGLHLRF
jgi:hypothetical protein